MRDTYATAGTDATADDGLLLDHLEGSFEAFNALRKSDTAAADKVLDDFGATDNVDRDIVLELAGKRPLGHPDRFAEAHTMAVRALEVLDRNGARPPKFGPTLRKIGPLKAIVQYFVQLVIKFIVRSYLNSAIEAMRRLYIRREANAMPGYEHRALLTRARRDAERLLPGLKKNPIGLPTFVLGGVLLPLAQSGINAALGGTTARITAAVVVCLLFLFAAWCIVKGSAVAHRRIRLTAHRPMDALWQTIGRAGKPPKDQARTFSIYAIVLLAVALFVIPLAFGSSLLTGGGGGDDGDGEDVPATELDAEE